MKPVGGSSRPGGRAEFRSGRLRVMLVDDHALIRTAIRQAIEGPHVEVVEEADSVPTALERAERASPDVVLVDLDLGLTGDGLQVVRELSPRMPRTTFVMLSASSSDANLLDAVMAGARGYLTKDVGADALLRAVHSARRGELAMPRLMAARLLERLVEAARSRGGVDGPELVRLSAREREVLRLLAKGSTDREIAQALTISPRTAETHVAAILRKLDVRNRSQAALVYRQRLSRGSSDVPREDATV